MPYAISRTLDPATGDRTVIDGRQVDGQPLTQVVLRVLRTQKGSYLPDPEFGVDFSLVQKTTANATAMFEKSIRTALDYLIRQGALANLVVVVERQGTALVADVSFTDPRVNRRFNVPRQVI
jgi:hypothetical protein